MSITIQELIARVKHGYSSVFDEITLGLKDNEGNCNYGEENRGRY